MLTSTRRRLAAASLVLLVPLTAACGFGYQTDQVYQPGVGTDVRTGTVDVLGAVIVSGTDGSGTFVASLANKGLDKAVTLASVTGPQGLEVQLTAPVEVPAGGLVNLADKGAVRVAGDAVTYGTYLRLTLAFDDGESTKVNVPVVDREGEYADVSPALPAPSGGASPSASASSSSSPSASPTADPSATATP